MFRIWSIDKARPLRRPFNSRRAAYAIAMRLEQRTGWPMLVVSL